MIHANGVLSNRYIATPAARDGYLASTTYLPARLASRCLDVFESSYLIVTRVALWRQRSRVTSKLEVGRERVVLNSSIPIGFALPTPSRFGIASHFLGSLISFRSLGW